MIIIFRTYFGARRAGLSVGSYHFYRPQVTPQAQLENMTQVVRREEQDLVPIIDIEKEDSDEAAFIENLRQFILLVERYYGKKTSTLYVPQFLQSSFPRIVYQLSLDDCSLPH